MRRSRPHLILFADQDGAAGDDNGTGASDSGALLWTDALIAAFEQALKPRSSGDPATFLIKGFLRASDGGLHLRAGFALSPQVSTAATEVGAGHLVNLSEGPGWQTLERLADTVRAMLQPIADRHDPAFWFALLVRVEPVLIAALPNGARIGLPAIYDAVFRSRRRSTLAGFLTAPWRVSPAVMTDLDQLIYLGLVLANVEVAHRRVGKGQTVALDHARFFSPRFDPSTPVSRAIDLYDRRMRLGFGGPAARFGAFGAIVGPLSGAWPGVVWGSLLFQPFPAPVLENLLEKWDPVFPMVADLKAVVPGAFLPGSAGITSDAQAVMVFLKAFSDLVLSPSAARRWSRRAWSRFGYAVRSRREFERALRTAALIHPVLAEGWLDGGLDGAVDRLVELRLVVPVGRHVILHGAAATAALSGVFQRPADGPSANVWANAFEAEVQDLIDRTSWRPPEELRPLIRKEIRVAGSAITDLDAVAYHDGVLLLIDCKSYKVSDRLAEGEYWAVTTLRDKVEAACTAWQQRITTINAHRQALGVPLPDDTTIAGVVVVPFPPFVLPGPATETVIGDLHRASTVTELLTFLTGVTFDS